MTIDTRLISLLVCPVCKGPLIHHNQNGQTELVCLGDRLAYPVNDGIPAMLEVQARALSADEADALRKAHTSPSPA